LWDSARGGNTGHTSTTAHNHYITDCAFSTDNQYMAASDNSGSIIVRLAADPSRVVTNLNYNGRVNKISLHTIHGQTQLIAAGADGLKSWIVVNQQEEPQTVGEFYTQATATALAVATQANRTRYVLGDTIGNLYILATMQPK